jgi:hypothetical protein
MSTRTLTKIDIAVAQLRHAIELFLDERELVAVITLAGAAEEIFGRLAEQAQLTPSLTRSIAESRAIHQHLWGTDPGEKAFANVKNKTRNELKHLIDGSALQIDLQAEAIRMLNRAVENYRLVHIRAASFVCSYERRREQLRKSDLSTS